MKAPTPPMGWCGLPPPAIGNLHAPAPPRPAAPPPGPVPIGPRGHVPWACTRMALAAPSPCMAQRGMAQGPGGNGAPMGPWGAANKRLAPNKACKACKVGCKPNCPHGPPHGFVDLLQSCSQSCLQSCQLQSQLCSHPPRPLGRGPRPQLAHAARRAGAQNNKLRSSGAPTTHATGCAVLHDCATFFWLGTVLGAAHWRAGPTHAHGCWFGCSSVAGFDSSPLGPALSPLVAIDSLHA